MKHRKRKGEAVYVSRDGVKVLCLPFWHFLLCHLRLFPSSVAGVHDNQGTVFWLLPYSVFSQSPFIKRWKCTLYNNVVRTKLLQNIKSARKVITMASKLLAITIPGIENIYKEKKVLNKDNNIVNDTRNFFFSLCFQIVAIWPTVLCSLLYEKRVQNLLSPKQAYF